MMSMKNCRLCPRMCGADRTKNVGYCGAGAKVKVALVSLHPWEEPCLVGEKGAGTIFFSRCNLRCCFCQNFPISQGAVGAEITDERLAEIFLEQQERGAANAELVSPTQFAPQIAEAFALAKERGFSLPVVYNSNAYECTETIDLLKNTVDVYLPDLKYIDEESARKYSDAPNYFAVAAAAITRMAKQAGKIVFDKNGQLIKGVMVRHLVLPGHRKESMRVIDYLWHTFGNDIQISLMGQYTPMHRAAEHKNLRRRLTTFEYQSVIDYAVNLGITQCYVQEKSAAAVDFVPDFNGDGVI